MVYGDLICIYVAKFVWFVFVKNFKRPFSVYCLSLVFLFIYLFIYQKRLKQQWSEITFLTSHKTNSEIFKYKQLTKANRTHIWINDIMKLIKCLIDKKGKITITKN